MGVGVVCEVGCEVSVCVCGCVGWGCGECEWVV